MEKFIKLAHDRYSVRAFKNIKLFCLILAFLFVLPVASCTAGNGESSTENQAPASESTELITEEVSTAEQENTQDAAVEKKHFYDVVNSENSYGFTVKKLFTVPLTETYTALQGACTDGTYYYAVVITECVEADKSQNRCTIYKYDMKTWDVVLQKTGLALASCNDMCYNPDTERLYVATNAPERMKITVVNPVTLEPEENIYIPDSIYAISYNSAAKQYVVGISGCENFAIYDSGFRRLGQFNGTVTGYTKQAVDSDDRYVYILYSVENVIMVYDWNGTFVSKIVLPGQISSSPQNLSIYDGRLIIGTGTRIVYRVNVKNTADK